MIIFFIFLLSLDSGASYHVTSKGLQKCIYNCRGQDKLVDMYGSGYCACGQSLTGKLKHTAADILYHTVFFPEIIIRDKK